MRALSYTRQSVDPLANDLPMEGASRGGRQTMRNVSLEATPAGTAGARSMTFCVWPDALQKNRIGLLTRTARYDLHVHLSTDRNRKPIDDGLKIERH